MYLTIETFVNMLNESTSGVITILLANCGQLHTKFICLQGEKEDEGSCQKDKFEENFKELTKWVDVKSSKFGTLTVLREKRLSRLGSALKVNNSHTSIKSSNVPWKTANDLIQMTLKTNRLYDFQVLEELIQNENQTANKKLYELKLGLLEELGWSHLATYEKQWMQVRFPTSLPLF